MLRLSSAQVEFKNDKELPMSIDVAQILGDEAESLLSHTSKTIPQESLHLPGSDFVDRVFLSSDRSPTVLRNLQLMLNTGHLAGTGYVSIFPVDQGIEHTAGFSFAENPAYFDPETIVAMAYESGCNAIASTLGVLGLMSRRYAHKIPFIVKVNHNELLTYPKEYNQILFGNVQQAYDMGAVGVGATIYFGSEHSRRQIQEISAAFDEAHRLGMFTVAWCYVRNDQFEKDGENYEAAADITGQANHLASTIQADIVKQKLPEKNGGFEAVNFAKHSPLMYDKLSSDHPIDMTRYQLVNSYAGRIPLISSGGESSENDLHDIVRSAVINKRAGGLGLIAGRKIFKKEWDEGVRLLQAIHDVYLDESITIA